MIDVRKLRMLAELHRLGTIGAVAEHLRQSAPGVSTQLAALEREIGVPLTERRGRRLALTPAGRLLATHGHDILDRLALAELEVDALRRGAVGSYRLAAFPSAARTFVADAWRRLAQRSEGIELTLSTPEPEDALAALAAGETDLAVTHSYSNVPRDVPSGLTATPLASEPVRLAVRRDDPVAAAREPVDLADVAHRRWITPVRPRTCYQMVERACGLAGFQPTLAAQTMDFGAQLELVAAGVGVALMPYLTIGEIPQDVLLLRTTQPVERHLFAVNRVSNDADPGIGRLRSLLVDTARARIPGPHRRPRNHVRPE
ncbi:MAG TPA: LysR family transcriptional regulator [Actinocatenispora sp.]